MAELNGYVLTKEEEKACESLIKKMRTKKEFNFDFAASVKIKAKNSREAEDIFWRWQEDVANYTLSEWDNVVNSLYISDFICEEK